MVLTAQSGLMAGMAFVFAASLVPALRIPAMRLGLVDKPSHRKRHNGLVPLTGGLAVFLAFLSAMLFDVGELGRYLALLAGMSVLLVVGVLDDLFNLRAMLKLAIQIFVALAVVIGTGLEVNHLGQLFGPAVGNVGLGPFSVPFTVMCIVFVINVINMADGVDGLAGGIGVIVLAMLAMVGFLSDVPLALSTVSLVLATAVAGFLVWNMRFPFRERAAAFMGDAGSMMLGFAIAWLAIAMATAEGSSVYPVTIAWILLVPCMDTFALTLRRISRGQSPMTPDRTHLHHIIQRCHFSVTATVAIIHFSVLAAGVFGIVAWQMGWPQWVLFGLAAAVMVGYTGLLLVAHRLIRWRTRKLRYSAPRLRKVG